MGADPASPDTAGYVSPGPGRLTLRDVTLADGLAKGGDSFLGGGGAGMGGAIFSQGTVLIERSTLTGNVARGGSTLWGAAAPAVAESGRTPSAPTAAGSDPAPSAAPAGEAAAATAVVAVPDSAPARTAIRA